MGDRGNIRVDYYNGKQVYFYAHWSGYDMFDILKAAMIRGRDRWTDEQYLARVIFCELVKDDLMSLTGVGISPYMGDNEYPILAVDVEKQIVSMFSENMARDGGAPDKEWSFEEFIALERDPRLHYE